MPALAALVHPIKGASLLNIDKRKTLRMVCMREATSRSLDAADALCWGGTVRDISLGGLGLSICYPFRPGTYLAVEMQVKGAPTRTIVTRVVHVEDKPDGTWLLGCEFVKPLTASEI